MNAIEIRDLKKSFRGLYALNGLNMTVPVGAIYGFIGENGSGKSTTMKLLCGHLVKDGGSIMLFGKDYTDAGVRVRVGSLIENAGCFPNCTVYNNVMMQALNLNLSNPSEEIERVLKIVRMEQNAKLKFKNCSLGMKQRIGIAIALLGNPALLLLDEPINGLDSDGVKLMREILTDIADSGVTVLISSHILSELEKIATHYGIIRRGRLIAELTAKEMENRSHNCVTLKTRDNAGVYNALRQRYSDTELLYDVINVYDASEPSEVIDYVINCGFNVSEITQKKIGLEEYYVKLMSDFSKAEVA